jgi:hypothetical protein
MAKPLGDKKPDHSFKPGGAPNFPLPPYGGYMGDPYGAYGGGGPGFNQVNQTKPSGAYGRVGPSIPKYQTHSARKSTYK